MKNNKKNIIIIGSTGSVGKNAIEIINLNSSKFNVIALVAKQNTKLLVQQAFLTNCKYVIVEDKNKYNDLKTDIENLNLSKINILAGVSDILDIINNAPKDSMVFLASLGAETLIYLHCAMENNLEIAIANKESIVCGGDFLKDKLNNYSNKIIPVDSEHSAIFQLLDNKNKKNINKILITASGGPFFDLPINEFKNITLQKALKHPIWSMGNKITIDSATLMNKALEVIEACYLFNIDPIKIEVLVDQKAILHGGVFYNDGTFLANFSNPHMKIPISYALNYPNRLNTNISNITLNDLINLNLKPLDNKKFKAINLAKDVVIKGGNYPLIFNITNEVAVDYFLANKISFIKIVDVVEYMLQSVEYKKLNSIDEILQECIIIKKLAIKYINSLL